MEKKSEKDIKNNEYRYRQMGLLIAFYRKLRGYTQENLSELLGISPGYMSHVEAQSKIQPISMELLFDIADVLEIEPCQLLDFKHGKDQGK